MSEIEEIYTAGKKFTLPPAVTAVTNLTSGWALMKTVAKYFSKRQMVGISFMSHIRGPITRNNVRHQSS